MFWQLCTILLAWREQVEVVLGVTEARQEVTFTAGCYVLLWIGIPQHSNVSRLQLGDAYYCKLVSHSTNYFGNFFLCVSFRYFLLFVLLLSFMISV